jgi:hypothetical protein
MDGLSEIQILKHKYLLAEINILLTKFEEQKNPIWSQSYDFWIYNYNASVSRLERFFWVEENIFDF